MKHLTKLILFEDDEIFVVLSNGKEISGRFIEYEDDYIIFESDDGYTTLTEGKDMIVLARKFNTVVN